jgi:hypothetical protein
MRHFRTVSSLEVEEEMMKVLLLLVTGKVEMEVMPTLVAV